MRYTLPIRFQNTGLNNHSSYSRRLTITGGDLSPQSKPRGNPAPTRFAILTLLLAISGFCQGAVLPQPIAKQGVLDLRTINWNRQSGVDLKGEWKWSWHQLSNPATAPSAVEYISFPKLWSSSSWQHQPVPNQGYATYVLTVLLPRRSAPLMLEVPDQYCAYRLFVNGNELAHNGFPATTPAATRPHWSTELVSLPVAQDTLRILLQIANFEHAKGGAAQAIRIGPASRIAASLAHDQAMDLFLTGCLLMTSLFFLGLFWFSRSERANLYYGLFCLAYSYRIAGTDQYVLHALWPDLPWLLTLRLEYTSLYLAIAAFVVYTQALYPQDTHSRFPLGMMGICLLFALTSLVLPSLWFTQLMNPFLALMVIYVGYAFYVYWIAARRARPGATYTLLSTGVLLTVFTGIMLTYLGVATFSKVWLFTGYVCFFLLQSLVLLFRFAFALNQARQTEQQFLANMSHEIRTPLNAILGFSNLLSTTKLTDEQQDFVRYVQTAGKNLLTTVNDILDIAKMEAGGLRLESIPFSLHSVVDSIRTLLLPAANEKQLTLVVDIDPTLPPAVMGDPTRLTQILLNLVSNAIKFTQQGGVTIRVDKTDETDTQLRMRFTVTDTGIGMEAEALGPIFDRFRQASSSTTRHYGGTGLGLSIVKFLTELQGGWVQVSSTPGAGSCFTLEIPYLLAASAALLDQPTDTATASIEESRERQLTILVVEDNRINQQLAVRVLTQLGYMAQVVSNGQQALDRLADEAEEPADLILMDIQMPVMDGYTATQHIRTRLRNPVPIIAMTAHTLASERERCLQAGMNDFLSKPFQPEELQRLLSRYLPSLPAPTKRPDLPQLVAEPTDGFKLDPLLQAVGGDMTTALGVLTLFVPLTTDQLVQMRHALTLDDQDTIRDLLHSQKVSVEVLGLTKADQLLRSLETLLPTSIALSEVAPQINEYIETLEAALPQITSVLEANLNQLAPD